MVSIIVLTAFLGSFSSTLVKLFVPSKKRKEYVNQFQKIQQGWRKVSKL